MNYTRLIVLFFTFITLFSSASILNDKKTRQLKKDLDVAKTALKNAVSMQEDNGDTRRRYDALLNSENTMRRYLADSLYADRKDIHLMLIDLLKKRYQVGNDKMYLNIKVDTAEVAKAGSELLIALEKFDSIPIGKSYRNKHSAMAAPYRNNLLKGGIFFLSHEQWNDAWTLLNLFLDAPNQPLFTKIDFDKTNDDFAAFLAVMCAKYMNNFEKVNKYSSQAIQYQPRREYLLQVLAEMSLENKDTLQYISYLTTGFNEYPYSEYFFPRLIDYHTAKGETKITEDYVNKAMEKDSLNSVFLLAKHSLLMDQKKYTEALRYGIMLLRQDENSIVANYNVGYIYYLQAKNVMKDEEMSFKHRTKKAQEFYQQCLPYIETYRSLMPKDREHWYPILYDAYLSLNMGKKFASLE